MNRLFPNMFVVKAKHRLDYEMEVKKIEVAWNCNHTLYLLPLQFHFEFYCHLLLSLLFIAAITIAYRYGT